jgi:hypothetical protein
MGVPKDETEEQKAIRLAKAKKNASKAREEAMVAKYKDKVLAKEKEEKKKQVKDESESEDEDEEAPKKPLKLGGRPKRDEDEASANRPVREEVKEETEKPVKAVARRPPRPKAKVIIEQSSDDEDTFEPSKDVIFVKRVRAKPKIEQQHAPQSDYRSASAPMPPSVATNPVTRQEQPLPQRFQQQQQQQQAPPPKPQMSQEKRLEMERYLNMTRGNFLPISRPR